MVEGRKGRYGGIVGATDHTLIDSAYSKALIGTDGSTGSNRNQGGGIIGLSADNTDIRNTYSAATNSYDGSGAYFVYIIDPDDKTTITNSYAVTGAFSSTLTGLEAGKAVNTYRIDENGNATPVGLTGTAGNAKTSDRYAGWDINNDGAPGAKWRIYEGRTLPLLTAFMNGRVDSVGSVGANYSYRKFNQTNGSVVDDPANTATSNNRADITGLTYDSKIVKIVDGAGNAGNTSNVTYDKTLDTTTNKIYTYEDTGAPQNKKDNIRNAGTKAILWSDQDGPNLRNVNVTINKRSVTVANSNITVTRRYNGKIAVTNEYNAAIRNGGITAGGITTEDIADGSVTITTSTDFKAEMDDKNVGENKAVTLYGSLTFAGTDQSNYDITQSDFNFGSAGRRVDKVATITKAPLILKVTKDSTTKVYDGTDTVTEAAMSADPNIKLNETLRRTGETDAADIKSDDTNNKDDVSINYANIGSPTYIKSDGSAEVHAGTHKIRYKNVELQGNDKDNYELYYQMPDTTQKKVASNQIDLKGEITRRRITTNDFKVYEKGTNAPVEATKIYDGNNEYAPTNVYLSTDENGATGIVRRDKGYITFAMKDGKGHFIDNDTTKNKTKNVKEATRVSYTVTGVADSTKDTDGQPLYRLSDYYVLDANGVTKNDLNVGFAATGAGRITPKLLTANVVKNHIEKTYDGWADQTDGNRTKTVGDPLVTLSGWVAGDTARTNTSTATYASPNVAWDDTNKREQAQNVTYNVSFDRGTGAESDNYILDSSTSATDKYTLTLTQDGAGNNYTGTIKQREVALTMGPVDKIYDGTAANKKSDITSVAGKMGGTNDTAILNDDGITTAKLKTKHEQMMAAGTATSSFGRGTGAGFTENVNASNGTEHDVRYQNIDALFQAVVDAAKKNNYKVDDTVYGKGTINRRLIEKSGFQVRKSDGTIADATKVYDGTSTFALKNGETLVAKTAASGSNTGVVDKDKDNIYFTMTGDNGHFTSDAAGANRTSHKSEANYVAYNVIAGTKNGTTSPLSNYFFGTSDTSKRNLEKVDAANPDAVTADGSIRSAKIQAQTKEITKVYDGKEEHTDGNRNVQHGDSIVGLNLIADASGQPTNTSTAAYADKNVARDTDGTIIKKAVNYTAQLTGKYADDYQIVDAGNNVISNVSGTGDSKTVTATRNNVADKGTITPRKLNIKMGDVTKTYDGTSTNASATVTGITDDPASTVINTILSGDSITAGTLQTTYRGMLTANTASSTYGRFLGTNFTTNANASNGTPHDVQYTNMNTAFSTAFGGAAGNYTVDALAYGKGTINRKAITPNTFKVSGGKATKVYDGTSAYTVPAGSTLTANMGELVGTDASKIQFAISGNGAKFMKTDGVTETANVADARKVAYNITVSGDSDTIRNYTLNGQNLESGNLTASGDGEITRRALNLNLVQSTGIDKEYDGQTTLKNTATKNWNALTDANPKGNVQYAAGSTAANKLVTTDGTSFNITSNYMNNAGTVADKNVRRDGSNNPIDKTIQYRVTINGDANNYSFDGGTTSAAGGLTLSATGSITPKDLSGAFKKVTKVYDRTTNVPAGSVGFTPEATITGDVVNLATHTAAFHSADVNGDGTTETIGGTAQKNWVEYSGLTLGGTDAGNYNLSSTARGLGEITPFELNDSSITFTKRQAEKVYDGTQSVKHGDSTDLGVVKTNYITSAKVTVGTAPPVDILDDLKLEEAQYDTKNVVGGTQPRVTYRLSYRDPSGKGNFSLKTGVTSFTTKGDGIITPKDVNVTVNSSLTKTYDATENVTAGMVKNAAGETVSDLNKNLTLDGIVAGDGTTYTTTAAYDNKNAGTNKTVTYDVKLDAASAGNYTLKFNNAKVSASNPVQNGKNEITKRRVNVTFGDVSKLYDTTTKNNKPIVGTVLAEDAAVLNTDHAGLVADDTPNNIKNKLQNLAGLDSDYGTVKTDGSFDADPNVGTKSVQYAGLRNRMNTTLGGDAGNYEFDVNGYGKGAIARRTIDASKFKFKTNAFAEKEYDGGFDVKWQGDKDKIKNYFASSKVEIDGVERDINLKDIDVSTEYSKYRTKDVGAYQTTADGKKYNAKVDYRISFSSQNFDITGLTAGGYIPYEDKGLITPKDITPYFTKDHIIKEYDGSSRLSDPNKEAIEKTKRLSILVPGDDVTLDVVGRYMDSTRTQEEKNASADTKEDAQARTNTTAGLSVAYDLKLGGAQKNNYTIGAQGDTGTVYGTGDIYKKTLTVDVGRKVKEYDGTAAVKGLTADDVTFQGMVNNESLKLDDDSIKKVKGQYLDSAGKPDANVRRDADRKVLDKAVEYTGLNDALNDLVARDSHSTAKNYRVEGGSRRYTADDGKGRIDPLKFHDPSNDVKMTFAATGPSKTYDRETTVKYKGLGTDKALKNYLTDATVMVGGKARSIKDELEIDPTRTHYDNKNAGTGKTVTYGFTYKGNNFEIADFTKESDVKGEIKRKDVKVLPVDQLWKTYDSERDVYVEGDDSIFTRRGGKQGERVTTGDSVLEVEPDGVISGDVVQNDSWAEFEDENAGTGKKVKYHTSFSGTDAANYRFVDVSGGEITKPLETDNNTIAKRKLNIGFDGLPKVTKAYDTDAKNDKITARITDDSNGSARKVLQRDNVHVFGDRLTQLNNTNIQSDYGEGKTDQTFKSDPNAGHKDVQYRGVGKAIRNILGGSADNYETVPDNAYSDGAITKADVSRSEFDPNFTHAHKEYDGTSDVQNLDERYDKEHSFWNSHKLDPSNIESLTGSYRGTPSKRGKDVGTNKIVDYTLKLSNRNFNFVGWDGVIQKEGTGDITPREIFEDSRSPLTKVYDGTRNIANVGDDLLTFRHKSGERPFIKNDDVRNSSTATYDNANVAWKNNVWNQGNGSVGDVDVTYRLKLMGRDAENYKIVSASGRTVKDSVDQDGTRTQTTDGTGKITPRDIHLKADPQTRWINEGLPDSYSGTPMGSNLGRKDVPELVPGEVLPGQIEYSSPNARLRWGDYAINGTYRAPNAGTRYQLPDGTWTTQSFAGGDGDAVSRNYRFVQDPANKSAFHMGPYVPEYEYYKAMTQVSKMTPDEYAYENASLDRRSNFGRDSEAEIAYTPPSINTIKDGVDITQTGIHVTDETVFSLVNEVFGGK